MIFVFNLFFDSHICPIRITAEIEYITANMVNVFADIKNISDRRNKHCNNSTYIFLIPKGLSSLKRYISRIVNHILNGIIVGKHLNNFESISKSTLVLCL